MFWWPGGGKAMADLVLGIDPAPDRYYGALYDGQRIIAAGLFGEQALYSGWRGYTYDDISTIIIETPDPSRGNYSPVRSRASQVMRTYGMAVKLATQLATVVPVYTPSREVILQQLCGWHGGRNSGKADWAVRDYLARRGLLATSSEYQGWDSLPTIRVTEPTYLRKVDHRDAALASMFNWQHPDNQVYKQGA